MNKDNYGLNILKIIIILTLILTSKNAINYKTNICFANY